MALRSRQNTGGGLYDEHRLSVDNYDGTTTRETKPLLPGHVGSRPKSTWIESLGRFFVFASIATISFLGWKTFSGASRNSHGRDYYLIHNARVYTVDRSLPNVDAFVVKDGRFVDVGLSSELLDRHPSAARFDGQGKTIIPGLIDAHGHLLEQGLFMSRADVKNSTTLAQVRNSLLKYLDAHPEIEKNGEWIFGSGWDQTLWSETNFAFPKATDLDAPTRLQHIPICLYRVDYHAYWLNTAALALIQPHLPAPGTPIDGGEIVRDADGHLTGVFVDNAMGFVDAALPKPSEARLRDALRLATGEMVRFGLTGLHDAGVTPEGIDFLKRAADERLMPIRNYIMIRCETPEYCGHLAPKFKNYRDRLTVNSVKLFFDGALGSWGAAMIEPYADDSTKNGLMRMSSEQFRSLAYKWAKNGYQVNVHCIGDRANRIALDGFEAAFRNLSLTADEARERRMRIEHAQIIAPEDIERFAKLGIIPSMQPTHATSDMTYAETRLGPSRIRTAYAWKSLLKTGTPLALGSDFPIEGVNPLLGIYAAVTRLDVDGGSPHGKGGWYPGERLTVDEALRGFTVDAARAAFQEGELGSITPGKKADFAVFDRDFVGGEPSEILKARCLTTVVGGGVVYGQL
ncbi:amidohydrolase family-domain-containing protein [Fimicolochytrium jonesii]|uniref:amidohydrolase family-domain-containing protein n=1 Tax=Fimicolochytrium jonesii TaxID=1396493 RepID=UPI0022FE715A|nr:amidohydrolase family-domain-containing protein [Fimicolochytrium jonesii]KAI8821148.1 amidohydrolase family-domain-containing protein [Fimicolochytrium jonesii]